MKWPGQWRVAGVLALFAAIFIGLSVYSYTRTSATYDEPINLTSGYVMLKYHDYRFSPDHVPFLRMWAALPLVFMQHVSFDRTVMHNTDSIGWALQRQFVAGIDFLYRWNDAERLLYAARFMMTLLGVLLGSLVFCWAYELFGYWPAVVALSLYTLEPNTLAHSSMVAADSGLACFVFGAAYFLWRTARSLSPGNLLGLSLFTALASVSKSWGLLLLPIIPLCLSTRFIGRASWPCRLGAIRELSSTAAKTLAVIALSLLVLATSYLAIWAAYDFRYRPTVSGSESFHFDQSNYVQQRVPHLAAQIHRFDQTHLLPNAYTQGFLFGSATLQGRVSYLNGKFSNKGWWYYFPEAFLIKTPVTLLLLLLAGAAVWLARWRATWRDALYLFLPPLVFFVVAILVGVNIGLRYVVLVYPFVALIAVRPVVECLNRRFHWVAVAVVIAAAGELGWVYPHCLAYFNCLAGGPARGYLYLADSNLDWGQDLKGLKQWMDEKGVNHINLCYFGTADPDYYHIHYTYLYDPPFAPGLAKPPQLPGYVAISASYLVDNPRFLYRPPAAVVGYSIYIYWVEEN